MGKKNLFFLLSANLYLELAIQLDLFKILRKQISNRIKNAYFEKKKANDSDGLDILMHTFVLLHKIDFPY